MGRSKLATAHSRLESNYMDENRLTTITRPGDNQSLCRSCYWAHAQKGFRESEEVIYCAFGLMRKVPFKVRDCTDYSNDARADGEDRADHTNASGAQACRILQHRVR